jgi:hypothetical protein
MSREDIQAWAKLMGVQPSYIRQELRRERNLNRAQKDPQNWVVLKFPTGEINAFPHSMFLAHA